MMTDHQVKITKRVDIYLTWDEALSVVELLVKSANPEDLRWRHVERLGAALTGLQNKYASKGETNAE